MVSPSYGRTPDAELADEQARQAVRTMLVRVDQERVHARYRRRRFQDRSDLDEVRPRTGGAQKPHGAPPRSKSCHILKGERRGTPGPAGAPARRTAACVRSSFAELRRAELGEGCAPPWTPAGSRPHGRDSAGERTVTSSPVGERRAAPRAAPPSRWARSGPGAGVPR